MRATRIVTAVASMLTGVLVATASPALAHQQSSQSNPTPPKVQAEAHVFKNLKSGKVLQAVSSANGARVVQQSREVGVGLQSWFTILDNDYKSFQNFNSDLNLGIDGASTSAGASAITANPSGDINQDWTVVDSAYSGDYFALKNRKSGLCLGISGASTANGAQAAQFACDGTANQGWILTH